MGNILNAERVQGLQENPLLNVGLGLLQQSQGTAFGQTPNNPFLGALQGLQRAGVARERREDRDVAREQREREQQRQRQLSDAIAEALAQQQPQALPQIGAGAFNPTLNVAGSDLGLGTPQAGPPQQPLPPQAGAQPLPGQITPFTATPSATSGAEGGIDPLTAAFLQYGSPQERAQAFQRLTGRERFQAELQADREQRAALRADRHDPVRSTQVTDDGRILNIRQSGKIEYAVDDEGNYVRGRNLLGVQRGPGGQIIGIDRTSGEAKEIVSTQEAIDATVAEQTAKAEAKEELTAKQDLPDIKSRINRSIQAVDSLLAHPGFSPAVGLSSQLLTIPGTPTADFEALLDQLKGQTFLTAFEQLKGGGQITEREGEAATNAIARLNLNQSETGFRQALNELRTILTNARQRAETKAGEAPVTSGTTDLGVKWSIKN